MENFTKFVFGKDKKLKVLKVFHSFTNLLSSIEHEKHFNWFFWFNTFACKSVCVRGFGLPQDFSVYSLSREWEMRIPQQFLKIEKKEIHDIGMIVMNFLSVFLSILPSFILFRLFYCQFLFFFCVCVNALLFLCDYSHQFISGTCFSMFIIVTVLYFFWEYVVFYSPISPQQRL